MSEQVIFWLVVLAIAAVIEIVTMGLTSIWFAGGALVAALIAFVVPYFWVQLIVFIVVSVALLVFTRPLAMKYFNKNRIKTNIDELIGQRAIVTSEIDNLKFIGEVTIAGKDWMARTEEDGLVIPRNAVVVIKRIEGVKLIVELEESLRDAIKLRESDALLDPRIIEEQDED